MTTHYTPSKTPASYQYSFREDPVGCGLAGCFGGLFAGFMGGILLLVIGALIAASTDPTPTLPLSINNEPDLRVTIQEDFLNRFAQQPTDGSVRIDILSGNQLQLTADTTLQSFGLNVPIQLIGLFAIQLAPQQLSVQLLDTQVVGITLPPELTGFFSEDIILINQDLAGMVDEISRVLGTPIILTHLSTTDDQIQLEIREVP